MTSVALRPAAPAGTEFCSQLHQAAMGGYITATWGWDEQVRRGFHARSCNPGRWQIITAGGADSGMIDVAYWPAEICLARIEAPPAIKAAASAPGPSAHSPARPGGKAKTWSSTCSPPATAPRPSASGPAWPKWPGTATATSRSPCGPPGGPVTPFKNMIRRL